MRRISYQVAMSLDGYIAGPKGEFDWIVMDSDIDFAAMFKQFDTLLMGRHTFEMMKKQDNAQMPGMKLIVFSRTLKQQDHPEATIVASELEKNVASLREKPGKDMWLFGGGSLFRSFLDANLVDRVEVGVIPILLGGGIPLLPPPANQARLTLIAHKVYKSGIVLLTYDVV